MFIRKCPVLSIFHIRSYPVDRAEWKGDVDPREKTWEKLIEEFNAAAAVEGLALLPSDVNLLREARDGGWTGLQYAPHPNGANNDDLTAHPAPDPAPLT